jgi:hypothetical protein
MPKRRLIIYSILILLEFFTSFYFILFPIRWALNNNENVELLYWEMRIIIVLINIVIAFKLILQGSKKFKFFLGLASGIGLQFLSYLLSNMISKGVGISIGIGIIAFEYILQIIILEFIIRYMDKLNITTAYSETGNH